MFKALRLAAVVALCAALLVACGGGGGGSSGANNNSTVSGSGDFSLSSYSATLQLDLSSAQNTPQKIYVSNIGTRVADLWFVNPPSVPHVSWLSVTPVAAEGYFVLSVIPTGLSAGSYSTTLRVVSVDANQQPLTYKDVSLTLNVSNGSSSSSNSISSSSSSSSSSLSSSAGSSSASLLTSVRDIELGGINGREQALSRSISISTNAAGSYTWNVVSKPDWLKLSKTTGTIGSTGDTISASSDISKMVVGGQSGYLKLQSVINGTTATADVLVNAKLGQRKLLAAENGVALANTPQWSRLTRAVVIRDNFGSGTWMAASNQSWLSVTPSGLSGAPLLLTANPSGLAKDQTHLATVTLTSADGAQAESIQVGFWNGSSTPSAANALSGSYSFLVADPVRPLVYASNWGSQIDVFNVYTGIKVRSINFSGALFGPMDVSSDGKLLFATDGPNVRKIILATDAFSGLFNASSATPELHYMRPNGAQYMFSGNGATYEVGNMMNWGGMVRPGFISTISTDQTTLALIYPATGAYYQYSLDSFQSLGFDGLQWHSIYIGTSPAIPSNCKDLAISPDKTVLYLACDSEQSFRRVRLADMMPLSALPGSGSANGIKVLSDGRILASSSNPSGSNDLWVYRADGSLFGNYLAHTGTSSIVDRQIAASSDGLMAVVLTTEPKIRFIPLGPNTAQ